MELFFDNENGVIYLIYVINYSNWGHWGKRIRLWSNLIEVLYTSIIFCETTHTCHIWMTDSHFNSRSVLLLLTGYENNFYGNKICHYCQSCYTVLCNLKIWEIYITVLYSKCICAVYIERYISIYKEWKW